MPEHALLPFPTSDVFWGPPADDDGVIAEVERHRAGGAGFLVVAGPASWWLEYFSRAAAHLNATCRRLYHDDNLTLFEFSRLPPVVSSGG
jgi:hypothetical protein